MVYVLRPYFKTDHIPFWVCHGQCHGKLTGAKADIEGKRRCAWKYFVPHHGLFRTSDRKWVCVHPKAVSA
jgi:hypothetical protein